MNYYVIEIADGDDKIKGKGIYSYDNERDALASFHKKLGVAMSSDLYTSDLVMVINESGVVIQRECWVNTEEEVVSTPSISGGLL